MSKLGQNIPAKIVYRNAAAGVPAVDTSVPAARGVQAIAVSAARLLFQPTTSCSFSLYREESDRRVYLQAITTDACAIVGPLDHPGPPLSMNRVSGVSLDELVEHLGGAPNRHDYLVRVEYSDGVRKPRRGKRETDEEYGVRMATYQAEQAREAERPTMRTVNYKVPPERWTAADIEAFIGLVYMGLPQAEAIWSYEFTPENWKGDERRRKNVGCNLKIRAYTFTARTRIPAFPANALTEWLESRTYRVDVAIPEAVVRRRALEQAQQQGGAR